MFILILVDKLEDDMWDFQNDNMKLQYAEKGQSFRGIRFRGERPTLLVDCIQDRSLKIRGKEMFELWWHTVVLPTAPQIIKGGRKW